MSSTTIITSCKGRLTHLRQSLDSWLRATPAPIIVVADGCPEITPETFQGIERVTVVPTAARPEDHFHKPNALNLGVASAETDHALFLDADTLVMSDFWHWYAPRVAPDVLFMVRPAPGLRDLTGILGVWTPAFLAVGGYDLNMIGWGSEDLDLRLRLYLTQHPRVMEIPPELLISLPHDDALRTRYYSEQDKMASHQRNLQLLVNNAERLTGQSIFSLIANPTIGRMFGTGLGPEINDGASRPR